MAYDPALAMIYILGGLTILLVVAILSELLSSGSPKKPKIAVLWVKSPQELELRRARQAKTGEIIVVDGKESWVYKPPANYRPLELRAGRSLYKVYLVDKNIHAFYEIPEFKDEELEQEVEIQGRKIKLNRAMLDPRTLFTYIGSKSMEKLIKPLRVGKAEAVGYIAIGGIMVLMMIFFLLPMMGYQVVIGGGPFG